MKVGKALSEAREEKQSITLYHGVKDLSNVQNILDRGFKLIYIKPRWINDYAISAVKSKKAVDNFFGKKKTAILKFKFSGNVYVLEDRFDTVPAWIVGYPSDAKQYTRNILKEGIDAVKLSGEWHQYFIYNVNKISNIEVIRNG